MRRGRTKRKKEGESAIPVCSNDRIGFEIQFLGFGFVFYFVEGGFVFLLLEFATHRAKRLRRSDILSLGVEAQNKSQSMRRGRDDIEKVINKIRGFARSNPDLRSGCMPSMTLFHAGTVARPLS